MSLGHRTPGAAPTRRSPWAKAVFLISAAFFFLLFVALGTWQVKRRAWKLDLIARVEQRVHAPASPAPGPVEWPHVTQAADEYRHVTATGTFLDSSQTLVQAVTDLGAGYWVLTPLRQADGTVVLVNRGFVAAGDRERVRPAAPALPIAGGDGTATGSAEGGGGRPATGSTQGGGGRPAIGSARAGADGEANGSTRAVGDGDLATGSARAGADGQAIGSTSMGGNGLAHSPTFNVTGLLRVTEPGGAFLRHNNPAANQWYSRDVQAIASARGITHVAPYFIDAEAPANNVGARAPAAGAGAGDTLAASAPNGATVAPVPGLTVIHFHNSHLVYAITWYTLALMTAIAIPLGMRKQ